jgi:hypothetical protein
VHRTIAIAILATVTLIATAHAADARPLDRTCDGVIYSPHGAPVQVTVHRGATRCATAKRILRTYLNSKPPCQGNGCVRTHSGWTCVAASAAQAPRVATCTRGRKLIRAYRIYD